MKKWGKFVCTIDSWLTNKLVSSNIFGQDVVYVTIWRTRSYIKKNFFLRIILIMKDKKLSQPLLIYLRDYLLFQNHNLINNLRVLWLILTLQHKGNKGFQFYQDDLPVELQKVEH